MLSAWSARWTDWATCSVRFLTSVSGSRRSHHFHFVNRAGSGFRARGTSRVLGLPPSYFHLLAPTSDDYVHGQTATRKHLFQFGGDHHILDDRLHAHVLDHLDISGVRRDDGTAVECHGQLDILHVSWRELRILQMCRITDLNGGREEAPRLITSLCDGRALLKGLTEASCDVRVQRRDSRPQVVRIHRCWRS